MVNANASKVCSLSGLILDLGSELVACMAEIAMNCPPRDLAAERCIMG
jgi:hypothetical protein